MGKQQMTSTLDQAVNSIEQMKQKYREEHNGEEKPVCPICKDSGLKMIIKDIKGNKFPVYKRYEPGMYEFFVPCSCTKGQVSQIEKNNRRYANVPGLYADASIENFRQDLFKEIRSNQALHDARNNAIRYITAFSQYEKEGIGLYIWSKVKGSGKSRLASTISNELTEQGIRNRFASASSMLSEIQQSWNDKSLSEKRIIDSYIKPRLLIVDDIGAKSGQNWMDEKFFQIIDARYQQGKPTIFTSNYSPENLPFDARIQDRICDIERFVQIKMPNESIRQIDRTGGVKKFYEIYENYTQGGTE